MCSSDLDYSDCIGYSGALSERFQDAAVESSFDAAMTSTAATDTETTATAPTARACDRSLTAGVRLELIPRHRLERVFGGCLQPFARSIGRGRGIVGGFYRIADSREDRDEAPIDF